jgi:hypothetical protein
MTTEILIDEDVYQSEVETQARYLAEAAVESLDDGAGENEIDAAVLNHINDSLNGHSWFDFGMSILSHAAIVHYSESDPEGHFDLETYITGNTPGEIVKSLAWLCFSADVTEKAQEIAPSKLVEFDVDADVTELDDETLIDQLEALAAREESETLDGEEEQYLWDIREEMLKRASVGGPNADYTGPE